MRKLHNKLPLESPENIGETLNANFVTALINNLSGKLEIEQSANIGETLEMSAPVEIVAAAAKEGETPKPATFDAMAYTGAPMHIAGWKHPVIIDLNGIKAAGDQVPVLRGHSDEKIVGHSSEISVSEHGVRVKGVVSGVGPDAKEVVANAQNGFKWQISNGSTPVPGTVEHLPAGKTAVVNGRTIKGPHSIARETIISEVSFLPRGADNKTSAAIAAQHSGDSAMTFEQWLKAKGIEASAVTDSTRAIFEAQWKADVKAAEAIEAGEGTKDVKAAASTPDIEAVVTGAVEKAVKAATENVAKELKASADHEKALNDICAGHPDILAKAKTEKWSEDKAKLTVIEASMEHGPMIFAKGNAKDAPEQSKVIEAALCKTAGMDEKDLKAAKFDEKTIEAAIVNQYEGFGLHALMYAVIRAAGRHVSPGVVGDAFIRAAFSADRDINASGSAVSNYSLSGVMSNIANKFVVAGFNSVEQAWAAIASLASNKDFKAMTTFRLGGDFQYKKLPPGGEIEHATMVEGQYTNRLDTYARMFGIDRRDIINDDMNVFQKTYRDKLGRGAGLALVFEFWTQFLDNAAFFTTLKGNLIDGILDIDGLSAAEQIFMGLTDENGDPINTVEGALLVVPLPHKTEADLLYTQTQYQFPMATGPYFQKNPHVGRYKPVPSFYLNDPRIPGYDPDAFYVVADPNTLGVGVIQVCFLNGKRQPSIESTELDFNTLGIQSRGVFDFGISKQEEMLALKVSGDPEAT